MKAEQIRKVHCLFEQSGTFKNEFIKLGIPAEDYDIQNNFNQTDHVIDLFAEIEKAYERRTQNAERRSLLYLRHNVKQRFNNRVFSLYLFL
jgi:hypothetical protein